MVLPGVISWFVGLLPAPSVFDGEGHSSALALICNSYRAESDLTRPRVSYGRFAHAVPECRHSKYERWREGAVAATTAA